MNKNLFQQVEMTKLPRNVFDLSHDVKMTFDMGWLCPILALETVPGDKFKLGCEALVKFAPLIAPVMQMFHVTMHYFFVPNRIVWDGWEEWIVNPTSDRVHPTITIQGDVISGQTKKFVNYMGLPVPDTFDTMTVSAIPFAAYQAIYNEYYRDQNLIDEVDYELIDGSNNANTDLLTFRKRAWEHDYFTSALPWAQKGDPVALPIGSFQDVEIVRDSNVNTDNNVWNSTDQPSGTAVNTRVTNEDVTAGGNTQFLYAKTSELVNTSTTIADLRRAYRLQEWLEKAARSGTRYKEAIKAFFGVTSSDARLQRPEYITGVRQAVTISEVLNNTGEDGGLPQGNMAGHGVAAVQGNYGSYFCEEHGYIIGIMSMLPKTTYQQGIPRHFSKFSDQFLHYFNQFAHIGEQEILQQEITAFVGTPTDVFGYTPRYAEYKYMPSRVAGDFTTSLNYWTLARVFGSPPLLNQEFVECTPSKDIFAVVADDVDSLYAHVLNKVKAIRPMPYFGSPRM